MKAFQIGTQQGLDSLTAIICPEPVAGPGEVIVAPRLVSLISRDVQILRGVYSALQAPERIPVSEGVGIAALASAGLTAWNALVEVCKVRSVDCRCRRERAYRGDWSHAGAAFADPRLCLADPQECHHPVHCQRQPRDVSGPDPRYRVERHPNRCRQDLHVR